MIDEASGQNAHVTNSEKPFGISILTWLFLIGGFGFVVMSILLSGRAGKATSDFAQMGIHAVTLWGGIALLGALAIGSGIGLLKGKKWGWWLASFYFLYAAVRDFNTLVLAAQMLSAGGLAKDGAHGPVYYLMKHGLRLMMNAWIYGYFFRPHVRMFLGVQDVSRRKAISIHAGVCLLLFALGAILSMQAV